MPAPFVYVFAVIGTVAATIAFKEFVYDPHIAPAIERWKAEYDANRRRRREEPLLAQDVSQDSDTDSSSINGEGEPSRRAPITPRHSRKISSSSSSIGRGKFPSFQMGDVELRDLAAPEVKEWRNEMSSSTGQDMRQRKNAVGGPSSLDESIHPLAGYEPMSPSRTHVILEPHEPSTPTTISEPPSPVQKHPELTPPMSSLGMHQSENIASPLRSSITYSDSLSKSVTNPFEADEDAQHTHRTPPASRAPLPQLPTPSNSPPMRFASPSILSQSHTLPSTHHGMGHIIPSLSQSYPQELDYEHGLELLSPPSSRSESPFSMAGLSPDMRSNASSRQGLTSTLSSSPLGMNLGNESYDTLSPPIQPQVLHDVLNHSPGPSSSSSLVSNSPRDITRSNTGSAASSTYLSFVDDDDTPLRSAPQPYAHLGSSYGLGATSTTFQRNSASPNPAGGSSLIQLSSSVEGLGLFNNAPLPVPPRQPITPSGPTPSQTQYFLNEQVSVGAGNHDPSYFRPHSSASSTSLTSHSRFETASSAGFVTLSTHSNSNASSAANSRAGSSMGVLSEGSVISADEHETLSDLDFMSDYAASDVGGDAHSESGWSFASGGAAGSDAVRGSPRVGLARAASLSPPTQITRR